MGKKKDIAKILIKNNLIKRNSLSLADYNGEWVTKKINSPDNNIISSMSNIENQYKTDGLFDAFVRNAAKFDRLSKEEEFILGLKILKFNDTKAAKKLILHNMRLSIKLAQQYRRSWTNLMDLVQEASTGMTIATKKWNPNKKIRFGTYAAYWIRAQLTKFLMTNARLIHTANTKAGRKIYFNLPKIRHKLLGQGKHPTIERIAKEINEDPHEVALVVTRLQGHEASLSARLDDSSIYTLHNAVNSKQINPEHLVIQYQINKLMIDITKYFEETLENKRDLDIWRNHLVSDMPVSLLELGKKYGVSKQRIGQLANRIKKLFRCYIIDKLGPSTNFSWLFSDLA